MNYIFKNKTVVLFVLLFFGFISTPLLMGLLMTLIATVKQRRDLLLLGAFCIISAFVLMNLNKVVESDLYWYSEQYFDNYGSMLEDVFDGRRYGVLARISEPVYHVFSYVLSNISAGNYTTYVITVTLLVYLVTVSAVMIFLRWVGLSVGSTASIVIFILFFGIVFTQSLHLIRQYIACSVLLIGTIYLVKREYVAAALLLTTSVLTHNSTAIIAILFISCSAISCLRIAGIKALFVAGLFGGILSLMYILYFKIFGGAHRLLIDDGSVSGVMKALDIVILLLSTALYIRNFKHLNGLSAIFCVYFAFCIFLIVAHSSVFLGLRYYFFLDFFRWIGFLVILVSLRFDVRTNLIFNVGLVVLGVAYLGARLATSPFYFKYTLSEYLFYPAILVMK